MSSVLSDAQALEIHSGSFYKRHDPGRDDREASKTKPLRNFNNWVKSVLISEHCRPGYTVLDLCCGKGGDLLKYQTAQIAFYVGVDVVKESIKDAKQRYDGGKRKFEALFVEGDVTDETNSISSAVEPIFSLEYDLVSSQFSINYLTSSEATFRAFLRNVAENLKPGGFFIGTIPSANVLVKNLRERGRNFEFGNQFYSVKFEQDTFPKSAGCFGLKYGFYLQDCVGNKRKQPEGEVIEYVPEYLVLPDRFAELALEYDLEPSYRRNFHSFYTEKIQNSSHRRLFQKLMQGAGEMTPELWEVAYLYEVIVLKKKGTFAPPVHIVHDSACEARIIKLKEDTTID